MHTQVIAIRHALRDDEQSIRVPVLMRCVVLIGCAYVLLLNTRRIKNKKVREVLRTVHERYANLIAIACLNDYILMHR